MAKLVKGNRGKKGKLIIEAIHLAVPRVNCFDFRHFCWLFWSENWPEGRIGRKGKYEKRGDPYFPLLPSSPLSSLGPILRPKAGLYVRFFGV
jgi:hypothetical protein